MYREFILEHAPILLFALFTLSAGIKVLALSQLKYSDSYMELFFRSFFPYSRAEIKNTNHEKLKNYYRQNNKVNTMFYFPFIILLGLYILMNLIA